MINPWIRNSFFVAVTSAALILAATLPVQSDTPEISFDGLYLKDSEKVAIAYIKPDADFSVYQQFIMLDAYVAFKKNWQRDTKVAGRRVSNKDMEKIKQEVAALFDETFVEHLTANQGYPLVKEAGDDVLIIRPAIIDLDITAPDIPTPGRSRTFVTSAGAATLYLELYDSVSGEILARLIDRKQARDYGHMQWSTSVSNRQEAKRLFSRWADMLRESLDTVHTDKNAGSPAVK